jgi:membrane associated rhomboid family serine protease
MVWKIFWEFPLTTFFSILLVACYTGINMFFAPAVIQKYFLSYPGKFQLANWILSTFYHASFPHLLSNVLFLYILGRAVEARVGPGKWLLFYILAGFFSMLMDSFIRGFVITYDKAPAVGASGAISGLAAVSALLSPFTYIINRIKFPLPVFLIAWLMVYTDVTGLFSDDRIAHWAHLAGFFSVFVTAYLLSEKEQRELRNGFFLNLVFFILTVIILYFLDNR